MCKINALLQLLSCFWLKPSLNLHTYRIRREMTKAKFVELYFVIFWFQHRNYCSWKWQFSLSHLEHSLVSAVSV